MFFPVAHLFPNAEVFEDNVQDLLRSNPSSYPAEARESQPDALGCQGQVDVTVPLVLSQGRAALLEMGPVARLGQTRGADQRVGTTGGSLGTKQTDDVVILCFMQCIQFEIELTTKEDKTKKRLKCENV